MSKLNSSIFTAVTGVLVLISQEAKAESMEKCVVKKGDVGFIKEHKADCKSAEGEGCAGTNKAGDASAWIFVPKGQCDKII